MLSEYGFRAKNGLPLNNDGYISLLTDDIMALVFRYRGPLPATNDKNKRLIEKQQIRRQLHVQIARLMNKPPADLYRLSDSYDRKHIGGFIFQPIICNKKRQVACQLEIRLYSRDPFGAIIQNADLDNRIKTLFDALRPPQNENELPEGEKPANDSEKFFWVLLEDDSLITDLIIKSERLLIPPLVGERESDIELEIAADVKYSSSI